MRRCNRKAPLILIKGTASFQTAPSNQAERRTHRRFRVQEANGTHVWFLGWKEELPAVRVVTGTSTVCNSYGFITDFISDACNPGRNGVFAELADLDGFAFRMAVGQL